MPPTFSVCICTRNRAKLLRSALASVCSQTLPADQYEILAIDNGSTDGTPQVLRELEGCHPQLRSCREDRAGLALARNRAAREAHGEWLAYLDDDALAPENWLETAQVTIPAQHPDLLGGPFNAWFTGPRPAWYREAYGSVDQGPSGRCLQDHEYLAGGNLFIRRDLLLAAGGFPVELGMAGERISFGEETALQRRLRRMQSGICIFYEPRLAIRHWVAPRKMQLRWMVYQRWQEGRSRCLIFSDGRYSFSLRQFAGLLGLPMVILIDSLIGIWLRDRRLFPAWQNYAYEVILDRIARLGKLYECQRQCLRQVFSR